MRTLGLPSLEYIKQHSTRPDPNPKQKKPGPVPRFTPEEVKARHRASTRACMARLRALRKQMMTQSWATENGLP